MAKVTVRLDGGTRIDISGRGHGWLADEPASVGGSDQGPTPYELLAGALGACTAITLGLYAQHKGVDLRSVEIDYEFTREHAKDCQECESDEEGLLDIIRSTARLKGDFTPQQRQRLEQIVSRCPVHKTLERGMKIFDKVEFSDE